MWKKLYKCPLCGSKLSVLKEFSYVQIHTIKSNGDVSKKFEKMQNFVGINAIDCTGCDFITDENLKCINHPEIKIEEDVAGGFIWCNENEEA